MPRFRHRTEFRMRFLSTFILIPRHTPKPFQLDMDEIEKLEMSKTSTIAVHIWYQWYHCVISHILDAMRKSESNTKQKFIKLF